MKDKIISISFFSVIFIFLLLNIFTKDIDMSYSERRKLKQFPNITLERIFNGNFFSDFEDYTLDQFVIRDNFRMIKSYNELYLFNKLDTNNLAIEDNYIYKLDYPLNNKSIDNFIKIINNINSKYLQNNKVYYSIIPDKSYFLDDKYIKLNYEELVQKLNDNFDMNYINIFPYLTINDYYKTDTHWKQESISRVVSVLSKNMHFNLGTNYQQNKYQSFKGVYYGQLSLPIKQDELIYLTNDTINNATVYNFESDNKKVYNLSKLDGTDPYDIFLEGATPFIEITTNVKNDKELVIFRDSFGSSIAPLLLDGYSKVTLIDIRYINLTNLEKLITFDKQDVLFLYSSLVINNSGTLKN